MQTLSHLQKKIVYEVDEEDSERMAVNDRCRLSLP